MTLVSCVKVKFSIFDKTFPAQSLMQTTSQKLHSPYLLSSVLELAQKIPVRFCLCFFCKIHLLNLFHCCIFISLASPSPPCPCPLVQDLKDIFFTLFCLCASSGQNLLDTSRVALSFMGQSLYSSTAITSNIQLQLIYWLNC